MRTPATRWLMLFPRAWRTRYGEELAALIEDLDGDEDLRAIDRLDLLRGGIRMHRLRRARTAALGALTASAMVAGVLGGLAFSGVLSPPSGLPAAHVHVALPTPRVRVGSSTPHDALLLPVYRSTSTPKVTVLPATKVTVLPARTRLRHAGLTVPGG